MAATRDLTPKGVAARARIVEAAADRVLARGFGGTSLNDLQASKGQLFHYFPGGKRELVSAIAAFQSERVLDAQRPFLDTLDTWEAWDGWRDSVIAHYGSQPHWGCPIGALASELIGSEPEAAAELKAHMDRWREYLEAGLRRMRATGLLRRDADPRSLALAIFAALHGGLQLAQMMKSIEPLKAALDGALTALHAMAATHDRQPAYRRRSASGYRMAASGPDTSKST